ncbi:MAG TPA: preprotein translocase subunit SecG [Xanthomonadaceae bacterium]|nr:preprotein translocase subunit SecG [Xanthomonadaceae bacterium]
MLLLILNVVYVLLAIGMTALILMQRGAGAQAGSGFGGGASSTVFGARGASNFLSKTTKWMAIAFFLISLFMAWYATRQATQRGPAQQDLGVMAQQLPAAPAPKPAQGDGTVPAAPAEARPATPASSVPAAPAAQPQAPAPQPPGG